MNKDFYAQLFANYEVLNKTMMIQKATMEMFYTLEEKQ